MLNLKPLVNQIIVVRRARPVAKQRERKKRLEHSSSRKVQMRPSSIGKLGDYSKLKRRAISLLLRMGRRLMDLGKLVRNHRKNLGRRRRSGKQSKCKASSTRELLYVFIENGVFLKGLTRSSKAQEEGMHNNAHSAINESVLPFTSLALSSRHS